MYLFVKNTTNVFISEFNRLCHSVSFHILSGPCIVLYVVWTMCCCLWQGLSQIGEDVGVLAEKARGGKLQPHEFQVLLSLGLKHYGLWMVLPVAQFNH